MILHEIIILKVERGNVLLQLANCYIILCWLHSALWTCSTLTFRIVTNTLCHFPVLFDVALFIVANTKVTGIIYAGGTRGILRVCLGSMSSTKEKVYGPGIRSVTLSR